MIQVTVAPLVPTIFVNPVECHPWEPLILNLRALLKAELVVAVAAAAAAVGGTLGIRGTPIRRIIPRIIPVHRRLLHPATARRARGPKFTTRVVRRVHPLVPNRIRFNARSNALRDAFVRRVGSWTKPMIRVCISVSAPCITVIS